MRSRLRKMWRNGKAAAPPDPGFAYRVAWTKEARTWDAGRRAAIASSLGRVLLSSEFLPNAYDRRYRVPELDGLHHSGASLVALRDVLDALEIDYA
jgi:hypothetical protein